MENDVIQAVLMVLPTIGLLAVALVGLVLWLMGKRIARTACAVGGLVLGGVAGFVLGETMSDQGAIVLPLVIGAALAGGLLAGLLFRVWVALCGAVLLALVAPAAVLVWQGTPAEPVAAETREVAVEDRPEEAQPRDLPTSVTDAVRRTLDGERPFATREPDEPAAAEAEADADEADVEQVLEAAVAVARQWYDNQLTLVRQWWSDLGPATQRTIYVTAAIGAGVGLLLGLLLPFVAASFESALVGSLLLLLAGRELTAMHAEGASAWFPQSPRMVIVWLGLITILGFAIQWTLFARRTDR
ncbi:hypothetical protein ACERK3_07700 [Phycisphaerales bacterium AB-hyl4]|uniref:Uncharacterized protein n=1 Tax=Natronomicrosphaera hydrolytica TaxID=3242702 RepID=A0ABV4U7C8_9BACT